MTDYLAQTCMITSQYSQTETVCSFCPLSVQKQQSLKEPKLGTVKFPCALAQTTWFLKKYNFKPVGTKPETELSSLHGMGGDVVESFLQVQMLLHDFFRSPKNTNMLLKKKKKIDSILDSCTKL